MTAPNIENLAALLFNKAVESAVQVRKFAGTSMEQWYAGRLSMATAALLYLSDDESDTAMEYAAIEDRIRLAADEQMANTAEGRTPNQKSE